MALTRWSAGHLFDAEWFYLILTAHGMDVLLVWIIFFAVAVLYFASAILLNSRVATPRLAWVAFAHADRRTRHQHRRAAGRLQRDVHLLPADAGDAQLLPGLILFAVGALIAVSIFFGTLVVAKEEGTYEGSIPLVTFGALTAAIIAVFTIASGTIILIPTWLWSLGLINYIDA